MRKKDEIDAFYYHLAEDRSRDIIAEQDEIREKYNLDNWTIQLIHKFYKNNSNVALGNVSKTIDFISYVLKAYGYSKEDITSFIIVNRRMVLSNYSDFVIRLSIFNKCGLLDDVFFRNGLLLNYEGILTGLSTRELYAVAKNNKFKMTLKDYTKSLNFNKRQRTALIQINTLNKESITQLNNELMDTIKSIKENNISKKLKK